ncbi:unknown [Bacteroides sp. CAG:714]|nr:unknown [Bacteroides sp. CAG:714]
MNKKALKRKTLRLSASKIYICSLNHVYKSKM